MELYKTILAIIDADRIPDCQKSLNSTSSHDKLRAAADAYCVSQDCTLIPDVATDPHWDGTEFFREDDDDDETPATTRTTVMTRTTVRPLRLLYAQRCGNLHTDDDGRHRLRRLCAARRKRRMETTPC
jgi:hypothetical protein